jgi:chromosomal replication initiator protein
LERKSAFLGLGLDYPVKDYLASQPFKDVRQLEGCLIRMSAQSTLLEQPLDLPLAEAVVREQIQERSEVSIQAIKELVGKYFQILPEEMTSKSRKRIVLYPRNLSIYLSRKFTSQTLETIARAFNRDSTSVIHAVNTVEKNLKKNAELSKQVHFLSSQLEDFQKKPKTPER